MEGSASPDEVIRAVEKAGYGASLKGQEKKESSANRYEAEEKALEVIRTMDEYQERYLREFGTRFVFPSDEFFCLCGMELPDAGGDE